MINNDSPLPVQPVISTPVSEPDKTDPTLAQGQKSKTHPRATLWIVLLLVILVVIPVLIKSNLQQTDEPIPQIYSSPTVDTIQKQTSFIASQSAFLSAVESIATLSAHLDSAQITEPRLAPAQITLPLGFSK